MKPDDKATGSWSNRGTGEPLTKSAVEETHRKILAALSGTLVVPEGQHRRPAWRRAAPRDEFTPVPNATLEALGLPRITGPGQPGTAQFRYSLDSGRTTFPYHTLLEPPLTEAELAMTEEEAAETKKLAAEILEAHHG